jgi:hypothetical protein
MLGGVNERTIYGLTQEYVEAIFDDLNQQLKEWAKI